MQTALDALYTTPPPAFVPRREELAARARTAGRTEDARLLRAARRPTLAAWAANLLLRSRPEESAKLLELGRALREAYRTLDAAELKSLTERRPLVAALARRAADLADEAGHRLSDAVRQEVEATLNAVLADEEAAERWASGRLTTALTPPSAFPSGGTPAEEKPHGRKRRTEEPTERKARVRDEVAERRWKRREEEERARQAAEAAEAAVRRLDAARAEVADVDTHRRSARDRQDAAGRRVTEAERELREAREELRRADEDRDRAEHRHRDAAHALDQAERQATEADRALRRPGPRG